MGKVVNLFGMSQKIKPLRAESNSSPKVEKSNTSQAASIHEIVTLLKQRKPDTTQVLLALKSLLNIDSEFVESEPLVCSLLPELLDHRDAQVHTLAKETIVRFSELLAAQRPDAMAHWRTQIEELLSHDRRTTRFVSSYPRILSCVECLSAVGKWKIQDTDNELPRFFLYLELESHLATGRRELSDVASEFLDFCGYNFFLDLYPDAIDYMLEILKGECLPQWQQPCRKVFDRLCKFKQHDRISQIMLSAVVAGDLGRVDWFTRQLYPVHFEKYFAYEQSLLELLSSVSMPKEVRESALTALLYIDEETLLHRPYLNEFINIVRDGFESEEIDLFLFPDAHPRLSKMLTTRLRLVRV